MVWFVMFRADSWIVFSYVVRKCFPDQSLAVGPPNNKTRPVVNAEIVKAFITSMELSYDRLLACRGFTGGQQHGPEN